LWGERGVNNANYFGEKTPGDEKKRPTSKKSNNSQAAMRLDRKGQKRGKIGPVGGQVPLPSTPEKGGGSKCAKKNLTVNHRKEKMKAAVKKIRGKKQLSMTTSLATLLGFKEVNGYTEEKKKKAKCHGPYYCRREN